MRCATLSENRLIFTIHWIPIRFSFFHSKDDATCKMDNMKQRKCHVFDSPTLLLPLPQRDA